MADRPPTLAALASIPTRAHLLPRVLASLRPQVDKLYVYLNGYDETPACVAELADEHVLDPENRGAEAKLYWADKHEGVVLSCDDDFVYTGTPAYVPTMLAALERWQGLAIVTAHGRTYRGRPRSVDAFVPGSRGIIHSCVRRGRFVNHAGSGVMAWDTRRVRIPALGWPERNAADIQIAAWAQRSRVPIWLVPHPGRWLGSLASMDPQGIFLTSRATGHATRNRVLHELSAELGGWTLFEIVGDDVGAAHRPLARRQRRRMARG